jgi:Protein of unknown function (DUF2924)
MDHDWTKELAALTRLGASALRAKYSELFGEPTRTGNKTWLVRRIAWRLQATAEGDLSERARRRAEELARDADLRLTAPPGVPATPPATPECNKPMLKLRSDARVPPPGTVLTRAYKGRTLRVQVLAHGFLYAGRTYPSLSAVAKAVTGSHCNGYLFFRLNGKGVAS